MRASYVFVIIALSGCGRRSFQSVDATGSAETDADAFVSAIPIATYPLNENAGQNVTSTVLGSSVNGVLGVTAAAEATDPQWTAGRFASALSFDATDDTVEIPYPPTGFFQTGINSDPISVSAWIFPTAGDGTYRVVFEIGGETNCFTLGLTDTNVLRCALRNGAATQRSKIVDSTVTLPTGRWYYVTCTNDGAAGLNVYVHDTAGAMLENVGSTGLYIWRNGNDGIAIGNNPANNSGLRGVLTSGPEPFNGIIDEVRVYDRAISTAQIEFDLKTPLP